MENSENTLKPLNIFGNNEFGRDNKKNIGYAA